MTHVRRMGPLLLALTLGCGSAGFDAEIHDREPLAPLPEYGRWWEQTEACARLRGSLDAIQWYVASGIVGDGRLGRGRWSPPHEIVLVRGWEDDETTVRHEMLHDLLGGDRLHEAQEWGMCGLVEDDRRRRTARPREP